MGGYREKENQNKVDSHNVDGCWTNGNSKDMRRVDTIIGNVAANGVSEIGAGITGMTTMQSMLVSCIGDVFMRREKYSRDVVVCVCYFV